MWLESFEYARKTPNAFLGSYRPRVSCATADQAVSAHASSVATRISETVRVRDNNAATPPSCVSGSTMGPGRIHSVAQPSQGVSPCRLRSCSAASCRCYACEQMDPAAIAVRDLTRRFGDFTAVDGITLSVAPGQFFGFLGPNGAGKSTTIKMLTGLLAPTSGHIELLGLDFARYPVELKRQIGVVPEGLALFGRLTASEYLRFVGRMYGLDRATVN